MGGAAEQVHQRGEGLAVPLVRAGPRGRGAGVLPAGGQERQVSRQPADEGGGGEPEPGGREHLRDHLRVGRELQGAGQQRPGEAGLGGQTAPLQLPPHRRGLGRGITYYLLFALR